MSIPIWTASPAVFISTFINLALSCSSILKVQPLQLEAISTTGLASTTSLHAFWIECNNIGKSPKLKQQTSYSYLLVLLVYIYSSIWIWTSLLVVELFDKNATPKLSPPSLTTFTVCMGAMTTTCRRLELWGKQALETKTPEFLHVLTNPYLNAIGKKMLF